MTLPLPIGLTTAARPSSYRYDSSGYCTPNGYRATEPFKRKISIEKRSYPPLHDDTPYCRWCNPNKRTYSPGIRARRVAIVPILRRTDVIGYEFIPWNKSFDKQSGHNEWSPTTYFESTIRREYGRVHFSKRVATSVFKTKLTFTVGRSYRANPLFVDTQWRGEGMGCESYRSAKLDFSNNR